MGAAAVELMCRLRVPMCRLAMCRLAMRRALPCCCGGDEGCAELRARTEARCRHEGGLAPSARGAATEVTGAERAMRRVFSMAYGGGHYKESSLGRARRRPCGIIPRLSKG